MYLALLFICAVLPGVALMVMIYNQDKIEKEPRGLLAKLFFFGMLTTISALILELIGDIVVGVLFSEGSTVFNLLDCFLIVACAEEGGKYFVNKKAAWKHPAFDYRFDGVVYGVFTGLGFAVLENILYVFENGLGTAFFRAVTSIPGHAIFGIFMGLYFGYAKECAGRRDKKGCRTNLKKAFWIPVLLHGFYDFCLSEATALSVAAFLIFLIVLYIAAFQAVKNGSRTDRRIVPDVPEEQDL